MVTSVLPSTIVGGSDRDWNWRCLQNVHVHDRHQQLAERVGNWHWLQNVHDRHQQPAKG
jgi:hypothetical protein